MSQANRLLNATRVAAAATLIENTPAHRYAGEYIATLPDIRADAIAFITRHTGAMPGGGGKAIKRNAGCTVRSSDQANDLEPLML